MASNEIFFGEKSDKPCISQENIATDEGHAMSPSLLYKLGSTDGNNSRSPTRKKTFNNTSAGENSALKKQGRMSPIVSYVPTSLERSSELATTPIVKQPPQIIHTKELLHKSHSDPVQNKRPKSSPLRLYPAPLSPGYSSNNKQRKKGSPVSKCTLKLDGYSYVIVASPPEKSGASQQPVVACPVANNGQLSKQGSLTILRRSSSNTFSSRRRQHPDDEYLDAVDLDNENLPSSDTPEAAEKAALRLRVLLRRLRQGEIPAAALQANLKYAAEVLESAFVDDIKRPIGADHAVQGAITIKLSEDAKRICSPRKSDLSRSRRSLLRGIPAIIFIFKA